MLNAEPNTTSDIPVQRMALTIRLLSPRCPQAINLSPHRAGRLARSKSAYGTSSPKGPDPWVTTLAAIRQFSSPPDPMHNSRTCPAAPPLLACRSVGGRRTARRAHLYCDRSWRNCPFALRAVLARPDALLLRRAGLGAESRSLAGTLRPIRQTYQPGRLGLYRPEPADGPIPLNGDAMILASELGQGPHRRLTRAGVGIWWFELSLVKHRLSAGRLMARSAVWPQEVQMKLVVRSINTVTK